MVYNINYNPPNREDIMSSSLDFLNSQKDKFDHTEAFSSYFLTILYPACQSDAMDLVGEDGNIEEATKIEIENRLNELLVEAVKANALRIVLSIDIMLQNIDSYNGKYHDLHELSVESDTLFNNLCEEEERSSFRKVYSDLTYLFTRDDILLNILSDVPEEEFIKDATLALSKKKEEKLQVIRDELLEISLEGASIENIDTLVYDIGIEKSHLSAYALTRDFPKFGILVYTLYHNYDKQAEALIELALDDNSDVEGYGLLRDFINLGIQDSNVQALRLLSRISIVDEYYNDHALGIIQTASLIGDSNILGFFLLERGEIFKSDNKDMLESLMKSRGFNNFATSNASDILMASIYHEAPNSFNYLLEIFPDILSEFDDFGFPIWHIASMQALASGQEDILESILDHPSYQYIYPELSNHPHIYMLVDNAAEKGGSDMLDYLIWKLSVDNGKGEPQSLDLVKYLIDKENTQSLEAVLRSKEFQNRLFYESESMHEDSKEYATSTLLKFFSRALYSDKSDSLNTLLNVFGNALFFEMKERALLLEVATNCEAKNCIKMMSDEFVFDAIFHSMSSIYESGNENEIEVGQRSLMNILDEVCVAKGNSIINQKITEEGENILMISLTYGFDDLAIYIIDNFLTDESLQIEAMKMVDSDLQNLIHLAVMNNNPEVLKKVLSMKGSDMAVNAQDDQGHTPATLAIVELEEEAASMIEVLATEGAADLNLLGAEDLSVIDWAIAIMTGRPSLLLSNVERLVTEQAEYWKRQEETEVKEKSFTTSKYGTFVQEEFDYKTLSSLSDNPRTDFKNMRAYAFDEGAEPSDTFLRDEVLGDASSQNPPLIRQRRLSDASDTKSDLSISSTSSHTSSDGEIHMDNVGALILTSYENVHHDFQSCASEYISALGLEGFALNGPTLVY